MAAPLVPGLLSVSVPVGDQDRALARYRDVPGSVMSTDADGNALVVMEVAAS